MARRQAQPFAGFNGIDPSVITTNAKEYGDPDKLYVNPTSRLHRWVCGCPSHITNEVTGKVAPGPYTIRVAGSGLIARCEYCNELFRLEDTPAKRKLSRPCGSHCPPGSHVHADEDEDEDEDKDS